MLANGTCEIARSLNVSAGPYQSKHCDNFENLDKPHPSLYLDSHFFGTILLCITLTQSNRTLPSTEVYPCASSDSTFAKLIMTFKILFIFSFQFICIHCRRLVGICCCPLSKLSFHKLIKLMVSIVLHFSLFMI